MFFLTMYSLAQMGKQVSQENKIKGFYRVGEILMYHWTYLFPYIIDYELDRDFYVVIVG